VDEPAAPLELDGVVVGLGVDGVELAAGGFEAVGVDVDGVELLELECVEELLGVLCLLGAAPERCRVDCPPDGLLEPPLPSATAINTPMSSAASRSSTGTIPVDRRR
jgi:hypothetical protein